jgi:hypothetical protein
MSGAAVMPKAGAGIYEAFKVASLLASELLTTQQVADVCAVSKLTLARWRAQREGPPFVTLKGGIIRYEKVAFERYLKSQLQRVALGAGKRRAIQARAS